MGPKGIKFAPGVNLTRINRVENPYYIFLDIAIGASEHALWTVEEFGIDGWRIDTCPYNDLDFMNRCNKALTDEYPQITMFGETWVHGVPNQSYFCTK